MSKRQLIKALLQKYDDDGSAENLAVRSLNEGIILGLRKAAKLAKPSYARGFFICIMLQTKARALAKKVRSK